MPGVYPAMMAKSRRSERTLGARHLALEPVVHHSRRAQRPGQRLEAGFRDVVRVLAVKQFKVQADAGIHREGVKELLEQLGVDDANLVPGEADLPDQVGPVAQVDRGPNQRLVHRNIGVAEADNARIAAYGLLEGLAQHNAHIFHRVVLVDVEVAPGLHVNVHGGVLGEAFQHVVEKSHTGRNRRFARAIHVHGDLDLGLLGRADHFRLA
jgi:hypothetical protein